MQLRAYGRRRVGGIASILLMAALAAVACGDDEQAAPAANPQALPGESLTVTGRVLEAGESGSQGSPRADVAIQAAVDRNGDGAFGADEQVAATSGDEGDYSVTIRAEQGQIVVLSFRQEGLAPQFHKIVAGPAGELVLNVSMSQLESLDCSEGKCKLDGLKLSIEGLPEGVQGAARVFNPVTQAEAFPGDFEDNTGNLLISGVFSSVELTDSSGSPLRNLDAPVTLRMAMPIDTWSVVVDIEPGNDRIEVPLYSFDETLGTWVRDGEGYLEDGNGTIIPESELPAIRDGSYAGSVIAAGEVTHFSYWNVDWPVETHGCVTGRILDAAGNPAQGATVSVRGVTYTGTSSPITVAPDGTFCVDVMRSEGPGEDVDQDGITGETQQVSVRVTYGGSVYALGEHDVGVENSSCDDGSCTQLGDLGLSEDKKLAVVLCTVTGTVMDRKGNVMPGVTVYAYDNALESEMMGAICGEYYENCEFAVTAAEDGTFTIKSAMLEGINVFAYSSTDGNPSQLRYGERNFLECPRTPIQLRLDEGYDWYDLDITVAGSSINWTPAIPAQLLTVANSEETKWQVWFNDDGSFMPPITYGTAPAGAEVYPAGAPPAMVSGDRISVYASGTSAEGYPILAMSEGTVP